MFARAAADIFHTIKETALRDLFLVVVCVNRYRIRMRGGQAARSGIGRRRGVSADGVGFGVAVGVGESDGSGEVDGSGEPEGSGVRLGSTVGVGDGVMAGVGVGFSGRLMVPSQSPCAMAYS